LELPIAPFHAHAFFEMRPGACHSLADYFVVILNCRSLARWILGRFLLILFISECSGGHQNCRDSENGELHVIPNHFLKVCFITWPSIGIEVLALSVKGY
tara:strand:- start:1018 stop:1317 length:300 start_codon:yes stop_codon:yes gene_type:complete